MDKPAQWALVGAAWFLALTVAVIGFLAWRYFETRVVLSDLTAAALQGYAEPLAEGAQVVCPVTKESLIITKDTPQLVFKNRHYYFSRTLDAAGHEPKRRFIMDPDFFVSPGTPPLSARIPTEAPPSAPAEPARPAGPSTSAGPAASSAATP